jgi:ribosomal protein S18 acetylase RimI-like enzyme
MVQLGKAFTVRQAEVDDEHNIRWLIERKSFIHRHLGWHSPLAWLGKQPFYLLEEKNQGVVAALAFPRDEDGVVWLRLFAVAPGCSVALAWRKLWRAGLEWHQEYVSESPITTLVFYPEMERLLLASDFKNINQVISLAWDATTARWPEVRQEFELRKMGPEDLSRCYQIDRRAFKPIWRNTITQLQTAYQQAFYASVIRVEGVICGYQISTTNPQGGHLARLVVDPDFQKRGLGSKLLSDLLDRFFTAGFLDVSVNTQADNQPSLDLYHKFGFVELPETHPVYQFAPDYYRTFI